MTNSTNAKRHPWLIVLTLVAGIVVYIWLHLFSYQEIKIKEIIVYMRINNLTKEICVMPIGTVQEIFHDGTEDGWSRYEIEQILGISFYGVCPLP